MPSSAQPPSSTRSLSGTAVHHRPLQLERLLDPFARLDPVHRVVGDQRRGAHRQRGADRAVALEHRPHRQQVVAQPVERALALAAHLEAADRPGEGAVGVGAGLQRGRELAQLLGLVLAEAVAAGTGRGGAGGDPPPAVLAGRGEGVGTEADAAALEQAHDADQLAQLVQGRLGACLGVLVGDGEVLRLPGGAAHALAAHRLDRRLDRVGADDPHAVRQLQPRRSTSAGRPRGRSPPRLRRRRVLRRRASRARRRAARGRARTRPTPPRARRRR